MENFDAKKFAVTLKWKISVGTVLACALCVALIMSSVLSDDIGLGRVILALVLYSAARWAIVMHANKKLLALLVDDIAPERMLAVLQEGKIYSRSGVLELQARLAMGHWQQVADICAQMLNDPKMQKKKHLYMAFLADMYFYLADDVQLRAVVDAFDAYASVSKSDAILKKMEEPMAYYRNYVNGDYESCMARRANMQNPSNKAPTPRYATIIRYFEHALVCYRAGCIDEARICFEQVVEQAPHVAAATAAQEYLRVLREGGEPCFERIVPSGKNGLPPMPRAHRVLQKIKTIWVIVAIAVWTVAIVLLLIAEILS